MAYLMPTDITFDHEASGLLLATGHKVADLWWQNVELPRR